MYLRSIVRILASNTCRSNASRRVTTAGLATSPSYPIASQPMSLSQVKAHSRIPDRSLPMRMERSGRLSDGLASPQPTPDGNRGWLAPENFYSEMPLLRVSLIRGGGQRHLTADTTRATEGRLV